MAKLKMDIEVANLIEGKYLLGIIHDLLHDMKKEGTLEKEVKYEAELEDDFTSKYMHEPSVDYPLGGLVELYDIEKDKSLTDEPEE